MKSRYAPLPNVLSTFSPFLPSPYHASCLISIHPSSRSRSPTPAISLPPHNSFITRHRPCSLTIFLSVRMLKPSISCLVNTMLRFHKGSWKAHESFIASSILLLFRGRSQQRVSVGIYAHLPRYLASGSCHY